MRPGRLAAVAGAALLLGGCNEIQNALDPAGPQASRLEDLWWAMFSVCAAVWVLTMAVLAGALLRRGADRTAAAADATQPAEPPRRHRWYLAVVGIAVGVTIVILSVFLFRSYLAGRAVAEFKSSDPVVIAVTAFQWWWSFRYDDADPSRQFTTANEIHIPVGRPVLLKLDARDVIHSFWVPNLHGKVDLIPGRTNEIWLAADRPGTYRGQCAEYCGLQHAHMAFFVVAEEPEAFAAWTEQARQPQAPPATEKQKRGLQVFLGTRCALCHSIAGTPARGQVGPDLTHLASRQTLGAGTIPNTRGYLGGWVVDPQNLKPGVRMPPNPLPAEDLEALVEYLASME